MWVTIIILLIGALTILYAWAMKKMSLFKNANVPEDPGHFPMGSSVTWEMLTQKIPFIEMYDKLYWRFRDKPFVGFYGVLGSSPALVINDLELAKRILIKDFDHFVDRRHVDMAEEANKNLLNMLTALKGDKWKSMRSIISPVFTSGKLKGFVPRIDKCADDMMEYLKSFAKDGKEINAKEMLTTYNLDVICSAGFGIEAKSFANPDNRLTEMVHRLIRTGKYKASSFQLFKMMLVFLAPQLGKLFNMGFLDKEAEQFVVDIVKSRLKESKHMKKDENISPTFLDVFVKALQENNVSDKNKDEDGIETDQFEDDAKIKDLAGTQNMYSNQEEFELAIVSNLFLLFFAGFDTQSTGLSLVLYYLATNQEAQERLYQDILDAVDDNDGSKYVDYNKIQEMSYMDAFIMESLRMYPLTPLERLTTKPYKVSNGTTEFVIPKGMLVGIPSNFMKDERYFKEPKKFDPENFSTESKALRGPYPFIAFGHGPRNCIGMRFALLNLKLAMFRLLFDYKIVPCSKTVDELIMDPKSMNGAPIGEIWVKLEERK